MPKRVTVTKKMLLEGLEAAIDRASKMHSLGVNLNCPRAANVAEVLLRQLGGGYIAILALDPDPVEVDDE